MDEERFFRAVVKATEDERRLMLRAIDGAAGDPRACRHAIEWFDIRTDAMRSLCRELGYFYDDIIEESYDREGE